MKKTIVVSVLAFLIATSGAIAAPGAAGNGIQRLKSVLGLDDTQATQIDALMQERMERMEALRTEYEGRIQALLTPEQASKYAEFQKQRRGGPHGPGRAHGMVESQPK